MFETPWSDVRYALRWLRRSPGFTLVAFASFALGIGFNTALFTLVDALLFRPLAVEQPDRLVEIYTSARTGDAPITSSYPDYLDWKARNQVFSDMLGYTPSLAAVGLADRSRLAIGELVTGNYFQVLGVRAALGRTLLPEDDVLGAPRVAVISHNLWKTAFASRPGAVGESLRIHGQPYVVVGVAPRTFTGMVPLLMPEVWTATSHFDDVEPAGIQDSVPSPTGNTRLERRGQRWLFLKGRLRPGVTAEQAGANLELLMRRLADAHPQTNRDRKVSVRRTSDVHLHPEADQLLLPIAIGLMLAVGLVLLIACANVASMQLARASGRQREISVRLAIGASRARLVRQLLTESVLVAALGAIGGILLAWGLIRAATSIDLPIPIPLNFVLQIDFRVLSFTTLVTLVAGVVSGLAPALKATQVDLVGDLKGESTKSAAGRRFTLRDGLVATQIAVTMVLLVVAGLLSRSLAEAQKIPLGFRTEKIAVLSTQLSLIGYDDQRGRAFWEPALARLRALPGVELVSLTDRSPFAVNYIRSAVFLPERQQPGDPGVDIDVARVTPDYFATLGISLLGGRGFERTDTPDSPGVVVINEAMAKKYWPRVGALGRRFRTRSFDGPEFEVVGVVADYKVRTLGEAKTPYIHFCQPQRPGTGYEVLARTHADAGALVSAMRAELLKLEPNLVFLQARTLEAQVGATLLPAKAGAIGVSAVGGVAMALAGIGLYGVIAYSVARRTREIGIRMALGARPRAVLNLILRQGLGVAAAGIAAGAALAAVAARAVAGALYGIGAGDPVAWLAATVVILAVSTMANLIPARRAARVNPLTALRTE